MIMRSRQHYACPPVHVSWPCEKNTGRKCIYTYSQISQRCISANTVHASNCAHDSAAMRKLQEMIDEADREGGGEVKEEELIRIMKKTSLF